MTIASQQAEAQAAKEQMLPQGNWLEELCLILDPSTAGSSSATKASSSSCMQ